jgi:hypothetical protein
MTTGAEYRARKEEGGSNDSTKQMFHGDQDASSRFFSNSSGDDDYSDEADAEWYAGGKNDHLEDFDSQRPDYSSLQGEAATLYSHRPREGSSVVGGMSFFQDMDMGHSVTSGDIQELLMERTTAGDQSKMMPKQQIHELPQSEHTAPPQQPQEIFRDELVDPGKSSDSPSPPPPPPPVSVVRPNQSSFRQNPGDFSVISELEGPTVAFNTSGTNKVTFLDPIDEEDPLANGSKNESSISSTSAKRKQQKIRNREWNHQVRTTALLLCCLGILMILAAGVLAARFWFDWFDFGIIDDNSSDRTNNVVSFETDPPASLVLFPSKPPSTDASAEKNDP